MIIHLLAPMAVRGGSIRLVVLVLAAAPICLLLTNRVGDIWEQHLREMVYRIHGASIPDFAPVYYDHRGIPFAIYAEENGITPGKQYNATLVANHALELYNSLQPKDNSGATVFWNHIRWLDSAMTFLDDSTAIYRFAWRQAWYPQVEAPFTSGMSSGRALEAFAVAFQLSGDSLWLQKAAPLVAGFGVPRTAGGFAIPDPTGWWYEEFADSSGPTPRILDGHMYALQGLIRFAQVARNARAAEYYRNGMRGLLRDLPTYDAGSGSVFYDAEGKMADKKYHRLIVSQLEDLHRISGQERCRYYARLWKKPLQAPYAWRMLREGNRSGLLLLLLVWLGITTILFGLARLGYGVRKK